MALEAASPQHQDIFTLRIVKGRKKPEIARALGLTPDEVAGRLRDAIDAVRTTASEMDKAAKWGRDLKM